MSPRALTRLSISTQWANNARGTRKCVCGCGWIVLSLFLYSLRSA